MGEHWQFHNIDLQFHDIGYFMVTKWESCSVFAHEIRRPLPAMSRTLSQSMTDVLHSNPGGGEGIFPWTLQLIVLLEQMVIQAVAAPGENPSRLHVQLSLRLVLLYTPMTYWYSFRNNCTCGGGGGLFHKWRCEFIFMFFDCSVGLWVGVEWEGMSAPQGPCWLLTPPCAAFVLLCWLMLWMVIEWSLMAWLLVYWQ